MRCVCCALYKRMFGTIDTRYNLEVQTDICFILSSSVSDILHINKFTVSYIHIPFLFSPQFPYPLFFFILFYLLSSESIPCPFSPRISSCTFIFLSRIFSKRFAVANVGHSSLNVELADRMLCKRY